MPHRLTFLRTLCPFSSLYFYVPLYLYPFGMGLIHNQNIPRCSKHKSSKTIEIYTHVSNRDSGKIKSPLDTIVNGGEKEQWGGSSRVGDKRS